MFKSCSLGVFVVCVHSTNSTVKLRRKKVIKYVNILEPQHRPANVHVSTKLISTVVTPIISKIGSARSNTVTAVTRKNFVL